MSAGIRRGKLRAAARALSLVEVMVATVVVGVMLVAALNTVGASAMGQHKLAERSRGLLLAQALLAEILQQGFEDSALAAGSFGLEAAEVGAGSRALFDDVDDYDDWHASPPQEKDGTSIAWAGGFAREVAVVRVRPEALNTESIAPTRVKRIRVTVKYNQRDIVTLEAHRTGAWRDPAELQGGEP